MSQSSCFLWFPLRGSGTDFTHSMIVFIFGSFPLLKKTDDAPLTGYVGYNILCGMKSQPPSFAEAMRMKRMARGVLTPIKRTKDGKTFYCLQYGRNGKHVSRYVPADEAEAYREATENYRAFMDAVNAHVDELTEQTAKAIRKEAEECRRKAGGSKSAPRSSQHGS